MEICSSLSFNNRLSSQSTGKLQCQINNAYDRKKESTKREKFMQIVKGQRMIVPLQLKINNSYNEINAFKKIIN